MQVNVTLTRHAAFRPVALARRDIVQARVRSMHGIFIATRDFVGSFIVCAGARAAFVALVGGNGTT